MDSTPLVVNSAAVADTVQTVLLILVGELCPTCPYGLTVCCE
jgi:hypothetical protein